MDLVVDFIDGDVAARVFGIVEHDHVRHEDATRCVGEAEEWGAGMGL